jgi:putative transposase
MDGGQLSIAAIARCKSRYFVEGAVLGSREWVNEVIDDLTQELSVS